MLGVSVSGESSQNDSWTKIVKMLQHQHCGSSMTGLIPFSRLLLPNMRKLGVFPLFMDLLVILCYLGVGIPSVAGKYPLEKRQTKVIYRNPAYLNIENKPESKVANVGEDTNFVCMPNSLELKKFEIKWKHNDVILNLTNTEKYKTNELKTNITIKSVTFQDAGVYTCMVILDMDMKMSKANLTVKGVPDPPVDVKFVTCPSGRAEISWSPGNDNGFRISAYFIQYNSSHNPSLWRTYEEPIKPALNNYYMDLRPWGKYSIRMLAENKLGLSKPSLPTKKTCSAPSKHPDRNPKEVWTRTDQTGKLIIQWTTMIRFYHHGPNFKYRVSWQRRGSTFWNSQDVEDSERGELQVDVDEVYTPYNIKVRAVNAMGDSPQPPFVFVGYSGEGRPLNRPKDFRVDPHFEMQPHEVHFIWEAVNMSERQVQGEFKGYKLQYWKASEGRSEMKEVDIYVSRNSNERGDHRHHRSHHRGQDIRATVTNLPAYTAMRAQVCVMNTHFVGHPSNIANFHTPEGKPGPVQNLRIESYGVTFALLKWQQPNEPNGKLLGYDIGYQSVDSNKADGKIELLKPQIDNPTTLGARITGLKRDHNYRFYVWARTKAGKGANSVVNVKTMYTYQPIKPKVYIAGVGSRTVNISWMAPTNDHIGYSIEYRKLGDESWQATRYLWRKKWSLLGYLEPGTRYQIRVAAQNNVGDKASSRVLEVQTAFQVNGTQYQTSNGMPRSNPSSAIRTGLKSYILIILTQLFTIFAMVFQVFQ
ncbi:neuroglian-like isoform X2 [Octopus sinensis]|uniref:Neuroglian-like isoform X2 n=1 Tax=Octopus sinensis TaxID=2607531 RepID=A0A7E6FHL8_9MOLL|nr:neuroglian-like isoform X2 [Octopus sinensis]